MVERLLIIGGDAAGMSAAAQARRMRATDDLQIVVFERGAHTSYAACGLPYFVAGDIAAAGDLIARTPQEFRSSGIEVHTGHEVTSIDAEARTVEVCDLDRAETRTEHYDDLLIAVGATPVRPPLPGIDADGVFDLRTVPDAVRVDEAAVSARRAVVVGGGYIGLETAEAFRARGLEVTLIEMASQPMGTLDADMAEHVTTALEQLGVEVLLGQSVEGFETDDDGIVRAVATSEGSIETSLVVIGLGVRPNAAMAVAAGIEVGSSGGIVVDRRMRTRTEGIWAAGDCVESFHRVSRRPVSIALGTHANKQGRVAGTNLGGGYATFGGVLGTAITRVGELEVARTGLNESEATAAGFAFLSTTSRSSTQAGYMRDVAPITTKVLAERSTGRLLGAQIVGGAGAAKRIDVFATALWNEMTVHELGGVDLSYAPPFSPVWDAVLFAAGRSASAVDAER